MEQELIWLENYRKSGDLRILGKLYEPYMPLLYGLCLRYYKDQARSEDAVMQIFESLVDKLRQHEVKNFKPWLYTLARNHCLMDLRRDQRMPMVDMEDEEMERTFGDGFLEDGGWMRWGEVAERQIWEDRLDRMQSCLQELPEQQQICVQLFYLDQLCYKDIAERTGFPLGKVKSYIQNGKRNLKICMERSDNGQ